MTEFGVSSKKENYTVALVSADVVLVPYRRHHVAKYHQWMCDPAMLEATASEALSLEEEYAMQRTWRDDPTKITFIVTLGDKQYTSAVTELPAEQEEVEVQGAAGEGIPNTTADEEERRMAGDVNLFLHDRDDPTNAEIEVMVAEPSLRRRGLAKRALQLLMLYGVRSLGITRFFAKIGADNAPSLALFRALGYTQCAFVEAFQEHELEVWVSEEWVAQLLKEAGGDEGGGGEGGAYEKIPYTELPFAPAIASDPED